MEQEKKCENCKFFCVHYVKLNTSFIPTTQGHCINDKIPWQARKIYFSCDDCCEKWESNEDEKKERKDDIMRTLKNMRTTLIHIENILKDDFKLD